MIPAPKSARSPPQRKEKNLLKRIISPGKVAIIAPINQHFIDKMFRLQLTHLQLKSVSQLAGDVLAAARKARHLRVLAHQFHQEHNVVGGFPQRLVCLFAERAEALKGGGREPAEDVDVFGGELEGRGFKPDGAGRVGEHEAEVDVDDV